MPANGYIYATPDPCQCYFDGKINGFFALSDRNSWADVEVESQLERGPAYGAIRDAQPGSGRPPDWPTYRGNPARSGSVAAGVSADPKPRWEATVGRTLTAPVVAGGRVYLADRDAYTVHCLDAERGTPQWKYFAAGAVDSPPTISGGRCVFGCRDGSVYCLDAESGELAWRLKTSRIERRIGWENRLASPLWAHGSVLVVDGTVYFAAGHSSNLDGGIRLYGLDIETGRPLHLARIASAHWGDDGKWGYLADVLSCDARGTIGMRGIGFDKELERAGRSGFQRSTALLVASWFFRL
jgi:outer membrane protein assembly factor BamB